MEFDAIARFLQDVGNDDTDDAGFGSLGLAWVARRARIAVLSPAAAREQLTMSTWCSGTGRRWAERRTSLVGDAGAKIEAATIWIHLDPETGKPVPWGEEFADTYLPATHGRQVDARLRLPKTPPDDQPSVEWRFRKTDTDGFGHVNNTAYLAIAEEFLDLDGVTDLHIEWRSPCLASDLLDITTVDDTGWIVDHETGETRAVISRTVS